MAPCIFHADFDAGRVVSLAEMRHRQNRKPDRRRALCRPLPVPSLNLGRVRSGHAWRAQCPVGTRGERQVAQGSLRKVIEDAGIDLSKPVVTSCGSGITAAAITLALETLGHSDNRLYDGSWTEWGGLADTPVVTGKE